MMARRDLVKADDTAALLVDKGGQKRQSPYVQSKWKRGRETKFQYIVHRVHRPNDSVPSEQWAQ